MRFIPAMLDKYVPYPTLHYQPQPHKQIMKESPILLSAP